MFYVILVDKSRLVEECFEPELSDIVTPINVKALAYYLDISKYNIAKTKKIIKGFTEGFDIGYHGPMNRKDMSQNIPLTIGSEKDLWTKIMKEVKLHRYAGPFSSIPYDNYIQSPIGLVPKAGGQMRLIFHLSYNFGDDWDQQSLNHHTPYELCKVKYRDLDHAVRNCIMLETPEIFYGKSDVRSAFRVVPILPRQRCLLMMMARNPNSGKIAYFSDKCLPFGSGISCSHFQLFSDCLSHIVEFVTRKKFCITNYLDDFLFVASSKRECDQLVRSFLDICSDINCPIAMDKTEWGSQLVIFLGILLDGHHQCMCIPREKRDKALNLLRWVMDKKKVTIKLIQRLTGTLNFLNKAIIPGRAFTRVMYDKLKLQDNKGNSLKSYHHISVGSQFLADCRVWEQFLIQADSAQMCRDFVDIEGSKYATTLNFYTDASLSLIHGGLGGIFNDRWIAQKWDKEFLIREKPSIEYLELYALAAGLFTWGHHKSLRNTRLIIFCDNQSVQRMVNQLTSRCPQCLKLIRLIAFDGIRYNRRILVEYVESKKNILADALSRSNFVRFWNKAPTTMSKYADKLPEKIWPPSKLWYSENIKY